MMKLTMVAPDRTPEQLATLVQLGADYAVHYSMSDLPDDAEAIAAIAAHYARHGLPWRVAEAGPALDRIVLGLEGWQEQTARYARILRHLGRAGVEVVAYNFMPQVTSVAMVVRTDYAARTRGGAVTSAFRLAELPPAPPRDPRAIPAEAMWDNLERFLRAVLPAAEDAGIRLAMHPDDPPMGPLCGFDRIMGSTADFDRLLAISSSPANAMTLCLGCFAERGEDLPALVRRYRGRFPFVHVRDIRGGPADFIETFPDDGQNDLAAVFRALWETGFDGYIRSDHAPRVAIDSMPAPEGYAMIGNIFALGYLRGLMQATRPAPAGG